MSLMSRAVFSSNTHPEDKGICTVWEGDNVTGEGGSDFDICGDETEEKGKDGERQDSLFLYICYSLPLFYQCLLSLGILLLPLPSSPCPIPPFAICSIPPA